MPNCVRMPLRLPPCLRHQFYQEQYVTSHNILNGRQPRLFSVTTHSLAKPSTPPKSFKKHAPPLQATPSHPQQVTPRTSLIRPRVSAEWINRIEPQLERVLLYRSPDHGAFFATSFIMGFLFIFGGYSYAQLLFQDKHGQHKTPWYVKAIGAVPTLTVVIFGTAFVMAPMKMIKTIAIVPAKVAAGSAVQAPRILRFEIKRAMPFMKPDVIETTSDKVFLDRNVPVSVQEIKFTSIPTAQAQAFTESYFSGTQTPQKGLGSALSSFNDGLLNIWPAIRREVRRMFLRDQMAYVRVGPNGNFKLDLQKCSLLDGGQALERVSTAEFREKWSVLGWVKGVMSM